MGTDADLNRLRAAAASAVMGRCSEEEIRQAIAEGLAEGRQVRAQLDGRTQAAARPVPPPVVIDPDSGIGRWAARVDAVERQRAGRRPLHQPRHSAS